ncbi:MaoC family dehydratase [Sulfitobacter sp. JB4-11]|uniref:MaoC family dehydratase n=1 Tax=Sulfitobacter rhodophyticola TaxID=3238304 RepID=UPI003D815EB5
MTFIQDALAQSQSRIGSELGVSNWITVDQAMIDQFADTTQDTQWIHTDPQRAAAESPYGATIAHGFLSLSLASRFGRDCLSWFPGQVMSLNYGMNKLRFLAPVKSGARLRGRFTLRNVTARNDAELLREIELTIEIEGEEKPALVAEWLTLGIFKETAPA